MLASGTADAPSPPETTPVEEPEDEYSEKALLQKAGIPSPPSQDRKKYLAWRKKLPRKTQAKLDRFCRREGAGTFYEACNGIGPYAIPRPPSRIALPKRDADGNILGMTHEQWQVSLSSVQSRYYHEYCDHPDEARGFSELCGGTPILLSFGGERVSYAAAGAADATDWPTAATPWLARDVDGDGAITSSAELFGGDTELPDGTRAVHGFAALAPLDVNRDGVLDVRDPGFASLLVWTDRDGDRTSTPAELAPLSSSVVSISLDYTRVPSCDARGNCEGERAEITWRDAAGIHTGAAIDVYLRYR